MTKNAPKIKTLFRELTLTRESVNAEARTVELAFSSELPVERYFGNEILDHAVTSVRLGRLTDGGPLLLNHDPDDQIGVVESVVIGSDRIGRAVVRFGKGARADEIFNDVVEGIRRKVSVGYMIYDMVLDSRTNDTDTYRITDWEPLEISIVSIPADNSVGVGRSIDDIVSAGAGIEPLLKEKLMTEEEKAAEAARAAAAATATRSAPAVDVAAIQAEARGKELSRVRELTAVGDAFAQFGGVELARQYVAEGKSVDALNAAILERAGKQKPASAELGLSEREVQSYSFLRVMHALANPQDRKAQENAAYEIEVGVAAADKAGKAARGIFVPMDILKAPAKRDMTVGTATAGGHTVATNLLSGSFIELLRNRSVLDRAGATMLTGLVGNIAIPRQTGATTAYWVAESGSPTEGQQTLDQVTMSPKTVGAFTDISRKLLIQSSIDVENFVRNDIVKVLALEIDRVGLYGSGSSNQPTGVKNTSGINTSDFAANAPTFAEIVGLETLVAADNADVGTMAYLINSTGRGSLKTTEKFSSTGMTIWEQGNTVNGYRTEVSNQVAANDFWFGNWADLLIGMWGGLDLMVDPYTGATSGTVRIVALQDVDIAVRHAESFARGNNTL